MGNRVAELITPGTYGETIGFAVYQSTGMGMFTPIFHNHLAAELFALALADIYPHGWNALTEETLAADVNTVVLREYGEEPERHPLYDDTLTDPENMDNLLGELREYRAKKVAAKAHA